MQSAFRIHIHIDNSKNNKYAQFCSEIYIHIRFWKHIHISYKVDTTNLIFSYIYVQSLGLQKKNEKKTTKMASRLSTSSALILIPMVRQTN